MILNDFSKLKNELLIKLYSNKKEFVFISEREAYLNIVIHILLTRYITICRRGNQSVWQKSYLEIYISCEKFKDFAEGEKRDLFEAFQIFNDFKKEYEDYKKIFPSIINTQNQIRKENELKAAKEAEQEAKEKIRKEIEREHEERKEYQNQIFNIFLSFVSSLGLMLIVNAIYQNSQKGNSYQRSLNRFNSSFSENIYAYTTKSQSEK